MEASETQKTDILIIGSGIAGASAALEAAKSGLKVVVITKNVAQCLLCRSIIESSYRHDFKTCSCGNLSVDGGKDYLKRSLVDSTKYQELSEYHSEWV